MKGKDASCYCENILTSSSTDKPHRAILTPNTAMRQLWVVQQPRLFLWLCGSQC